MIPPGASASTVLLRVAPIRSFAGFSLCADELRRVRRELGVTIDDAARVAHVPVPELVAVERGLLAFATREAYETVLERVRGLAAHRARKMASGEG